MVRVTKSLPISFSVGGMKPQVASGWSLFASKPSSKTQSGFVGKTWHMTIDKARSREECWEQLDKERDPEQDKGNFKGHTCWAIDLHLLVDSSDGNLETAEAVKPG